MTSRSTDRADPAVVTRPGSGWAWAAFAVGLAHALVSAAWALGSRGLLLAVGRRRSSPRRAQTTTDDPRRTP